MSIDSNAAQFERMGNPWITPAEQARDFAPTNAARISRPKFRPDMPAPDKAPIPLEIRREFACCHALARVTAKAPDHELAQMAVRNALHRTTPKHGEPDFFKDDTKDRASAYAAHIAAIPSPAQELAARAAIVAAQHDRWSNALAVMLVVLPRRRILSIR